MDTKQVHITTQLRRNAVALISLVIAVTSLSYNTWRNEKTEDNRNRRVAAFEILLKLGDLQEVVFHHHYDMDRSGRGSPRTGWVYVLTIHDLSRVLPPPMPEAADRLQSVWEDHWETLADQQASADAVVAGIGQMRDSTLQLLESLE